MTELGCRAIVTKRSADLAQIDALDWAESHLKRQLLDAGCTDIETHRQFFPEGMTDEEGNVIYNFPFYEISAYGEVADQ